MRTPIIRQLAAGGVTIGLPMFTRLPVRCLRMALVLWAICGLGGTADAQIVPMTVAQQTELEAAIDDRDHRDAAFVALAENVGNWTPPIGDAAIRLQPDMKAMMENPQAYRGELCRIEGVVQQVDAVEPAYGDELVGIFLRNDNGPVLVFVPMVELAALTGGKTAGAVGSRVSVIARFYKRVSYEARDGQVRSYPAFVGGFVKRVGGEARAGAGEQLVLVVPVVALFAAFAILLIYTRRQRKHRPIGVNHGRGAHRDDDDWIASDPPLPDDPVDAMSELRKRHEA